MQDRDDHKTTFTITSAQLFKKKCAENVGCT
jgi:hypothetical protein